MGSITNGAVKTMSVDEGTEVIDKIANGFGSPMMRSPVLRTPAECGLQYQDVFYQAQDGVPLEAWLIPCSGSKKLIIVNHPRWMNRYGCPTNLEPWKSLGSWGGQRNTLEINFIPDFKILHDAGYVVLAYDSRNMGLSGAANGGMGIAGRFESRDVIGSLQFVRQHPHLKDMAIGFFCRCNGANATLFGMYTQPEHFLDVRCMVAAQPLSVRATLTRNLELMGIADRIDELDHKIKLATGFGLDQMSPIPWAKGVAIPTFMYQVREDKMTFEADVQSVFNSMPVKEKYLHWIEDTTARWDGYREFQERPQPMLDWFAKYM